LKGSKIIEELRTKQLELHQFMMESLQILFEDLSGLDFVLIFKLLGGQKTCEYLSQLESCVHLAGFSIMGHTIQAKFIHKTCCTQLSAFFLQCNSTKRKILYK